jgi:hypothetical protein
MVPLVRSVPLGHSDRLGLWGLLVQMGLTGLMDLWGRSDRSRLPFQRDLWGRMGQSDRWGLTDPSVLSGRLGRCRPGFPFDRSRPWGR